MVAGLSGTMKMAIQKSIVRLYYKDTGDVNILIGFC
jgi:hypothetical protein